MVKILIFDTSILCVWLGVPGKEKGVADYYAKSGYEVEILTGDGGLKSYEPAKPPLIPRRKQK